MSTAHASTQVSRYVALDVHRSYLVVGAVYSQQHIMLSPRRFGFERFAAWAPTHLSEADAVVLEASAARVKTDARDTIKLARRLSANLIPAVWVPPLPVGELRALVTHRKRLVQQRIQARNRLQGVLQRHNLDAKDGKGLRTGSP